MNIEREDAISLAGCDVEQELVNGFRNGCRESAEQLFTEMSGPLSATLRRLTGWSVSRDSEVEDIKQSVFLAAWQHRKQFRGGSSFKTWLTRIAINEWRKRQRRQSLFRKWWTQLVPPSIEHEEIHEEPLNQRETLASVRRAVQQLSNRQREVVVLYYLEDMTASEVAEVLELNQGTVEVRLSRARRRLAQLLGAST